jgi:hypothetical protein
MFQKVIMSRFLIHLILLLGAFGFAVPYLQHTNSDALYSKGDFSYVLNISETFPRNFFVYDSLLTNGYERYVPTLLSLNTPYLVILYILDLVNTGGPLSLLAFIGLMNFVGCLSMYYFIKHVFKSYFKIEGDAASWPALFGSMLYIFSPFFTEYYSPGHFLFLILPATFPLILLIYDKFIDTKYPLYAYLLFLLFVFTALPYGNLGVVFIFIQLMGIYTLLRILIGSVSVKWGLVAFTIFTVIFISSHFWWMYPTVKGFIPNLGLLDSQSKETIGGSLAFATRNSTSLNIFLGSPDNILPFAAKNQFILVSKIVGFIYILLTVYILSLYVFLKGRAMRGYAPLIGLFLLLGFYFTKGPNPPYPEFFLYLFDNVLGFQAFRRPASKIYWLYLFSFSLLVSLSYYYHKSVVKSNVLRNLYNTVPVVIIIFFVFIYSNTKDLSPFSVSRGYYEARSYLSGDNATGVLLLPDLGGVFPKYGDSLNGLEGLDFVPQVWDVPTYVPGENEWVLLNPFRDELNTMAEKIEQGISVCDSLKVLNISHIVIREDLVDNGRYDKKLLESQRASLTLSPDIADVTRFDKDVTIFSIVQECRSSVIYSNETVVYYQKESPVSYRVYIQGLGDSDALHFLNPSPAQWGLYLIPWSPLEKCRNPVQHFSTGAMECVATSTKFFDISVYRERQYETTSVSDSGISNLWLLDKNSVKENYPSGYYKVNRDGSIDMVMLVYFEPQKDVVIGGVVTLLVFVLLTTSVLISARLPKYLH